MPDEPRKAKILFLASNIDAFIKTDLQLLQKHFDVKPLVWDGRLSWPKLVVETLRTNAIFSWFAGDHSAFASMLSAKIGKPSILVSGGVDVAAMPEIGYGAMAKSVRWRLPTKAALCFSTLVLAFSDFSKGEISRAHEPKDLRTLYPGVDTHKFVPAATKEETVVTVGQVSNSNLTRKGLQHFANVAKLLPQYRFVLAGRRLDDSFDRLRSEAPPNMTLTGFIQDKELVELYAKSKVYVQASAHEGFGVSLAEAMSAGCIPVVTDRGALPEVAGDIGSMVGFGDEKGLAEAISHAMLMPALEGIRARKRILDNFSLERRESSLKRVIDEKIEGG